MKNVWSIICGLAMGSVSLTYACEQYLLPPVPAQSATTAVIKNYQEQVLEVAQRRLTALLRPLIEPLIEQAIKNQSLLDLWQQEMRFRETLGHDPQHFPPEQLTALLPRYLEQFNHIFFPALANFLQARDLPWQLINLAQDHQPAVNAIALTIDAQNPPSAATLQAWQNDPVMRSVAQLAQDILAYWKKHHISTKVDLVLADLDALALSANPQAADDKLLEKSAETKAAVFAKYVGQNIILLPENIFHQLYERDLLVNNTFIRYLSNGRTWKITPLHPAVDDFSFNYDELGLFLETSRSLKRVAALNLPPEQITYHDINFEFLPKYDSDARRSTMIMRYHLLQKHLKAVNQRLLISPANRSPYDNIKITRKDHLAPSLQALSKSGQDYYYEASLKYTVDHVAYQLTYPIILGASDPLTADILNAEKNYTGRELARKLQRTVHHKLVYLYESNDLKFFKEITNTDPAQWEDLWEKERLLWPNIAPRAWRPKTEGIQKSRVFLPKYE